MAEDSKAAGTRRRAEALRANLRRRKVAAAEVRQDASDIPDGAHHAPADESARAAGADGGERE